LKAKHGREQHRIARIATASPSEVVEEEERFMMPSFLCGIPLPGISY
jgi:hypothetical protein